MEEKSYWKKKNYNYFIILHIEVIIKCKYFTGRWGGSTENLRKTILFL